MTKQVSIQDEDYALANDLAERLGVTVDETMTRAVRELARRTPAPGRLDPDQQAELAAIRALVTEARRHVVPGAVNDHGYLYDRNGLPT